MTKYLDKSLKIKLYFFCYPSHGNMKNNVILGHVDFINKNIVHCLMSKNSKKIFILKKL
jgi:hypothetical protein